MRAKIETRKYVLSFVITAMVFFGALLASNRFAERRLAEVKSIEDKISLDLLSSETQFALLKESSCKAIDHSTAFSEELNSLTQKLSYMEDNLGGENPEVLSLKKYYSLLQIKDSLLVKQVNEKCGVKPITIIYFYSNKGDCEDCKREGYVLTKLREEYPELRIYSFDYNLDVSALQTLIDIENVGSEMPGLVISGKTYYGFRNISDIEKILPQLSTLKKNTASTSAATTKR